MEQRRQHQYAMSHWRESRLGIGAIHVRKMHPTATVLQPRVHRARPCAMKRPELSDSAEALEERGRHDGGTEGRDVDHTMNTVINELLGWYRVAHFSLKR